MVLGIGGYSLIDYSEGTVRGESFKAGPWFFPADFVLVVEVLAVGFCGLGWWIPLDSVVNSCCEQ